MRQLRGPTLWPIACCLAAAWLEPGAAAAATLRGTISATFPLTRIVAVQRARADVLVVSRKLTGPHMHAGTIKANGSFAIPGLKRGRRYDLVVFSHKARWEGVNMAYYRQVKPVGRCTAADRKQIMVLITKVPRFFNINEPLWIAADHHHATVLVKELRTTSFYSGGAQVIYRVELWYLQNYFGGWAKVNNTEKTITRWRGLASGLPRVWQYVPQLGAVKIPRKGPARFHAVLPPQPGEKHGLVHGLHVHKRK